MVLNSGAYKSFPNVGHIPQLINLIIHYELGNISSLPYYIKSIYRSLYRSDRLYEPEKMILQFLKKLPDINNQEQLVDGFRRLREELAKIMAQPHETSLLDHLDYISWLDSKIDGKSYAEVVRDNLNGDVGR